MFIPIAEGGKYIAWSNFGLVCWPAFMPRWRREPTGQCLWLPFCT